MVIWLASVFKKRGNTGIYFEQTSRSIAKFLEKGKQYKICYQGASLPDSTLLNLISFLSIEST